MIELFWPYMPKEAIEEVSKVLSSRFIGQGPKVDLFEKEFEKFFNVKYAVSLNSGTSALETAYDLIGLKKGDSVISTPLTCLATNLELLRRGCKIIWADILENTLCIDPVDVKRKITKKTKAVVQVHLGGIKADVGKLNIPVVSDAAQALGIFTGDYTCCSFQAIKQITTCDGGMLICPTERKRNEAKLFRWFGIDRNKKIKNNWQAYKERKMTFDVKFAGTKRHMNDVAATMGIVGLAHYNYIQTVRGKQFSLYKEFLKDMDGIKIVDDPINMHWLMTILVERRDDFAKMLFEAGIDCNTVQVRNDIYAVFGGKRTDLPIMNKVEDKYISIPIGVHIKNEDIEYVCSCIKKGW